jgi:hypothetical protein
MRGTAHSRFGAPEPEVIPRLLVEVAGTLDKLRSLIASPGTL